jgi:putative ABC transport system permease protein
MTRKLLAIATRNLRRQPRRTILTALAFAIAVFIFTLLIAVPQSMDRMAADASKGLRLVVEPHNAYRLPARYCETIKRLPHVLGCAPEIVWSGIYRDPRDLIMTYGVTPDIVTVTSSSDYQIAPDQRRQFDSDPRSALIGSVLMREHGWKVGEPLILPSPSDSRLSLTFIPRLALPTSYLSRMFFFNRRLLDNAVKDTYGTDIQERATFLAVRVDRAENMGVVADSIDQTFHNSDYETATLTESDTLANFASAIGDVRTIIYGLCLVVLLTVLLIAANSMAMVVRDRINEVAVMRAMGFARSQVILMLLGEAALIGLAGAIVGAALALYWFGQGISPVAALVRIGDVEIRLSTAVVAVAAAFIISILSAALPVASAVHTPPAIALRKLI